LTLFEFLIEAASELPSIVAEITYRADQPLPLNKDETMVNVQQYEPIIQ
jgi:hypothetical protein